MKKALSRKNLLDSRMCDLPVEISDPAMGRYVKKLYKELEAKGLKDFKPKIYIGDEWCSPEGVVAIGVPFYLFSPLLRRLEQKLTGDIDGRSPSLCMKLLRHEAGHCFDHAFQVSQSRKWRQLFGDRGKPYNLDHYQTTPRSRDFVAHLPYQYAQSHPDEDFAETFAVWLNPRSRWRIKYQDNPKVLAKLMFIDRLAKRFQNHRPRLSPGPKLGQISVIKKTLRTHYLEQGQKLDFLRP